MEITQIQIKQNNQTNQLNDGKNKLTQESEAQMMAFDQILAMFQAVSSSPDLVDSTAQPNQNKVDKSVGEEAEQNSINMGNRMINSIVSNTSIMNNTSIIASKSIVDTKSINDSKIESENESDFVLESNSISEFGHISNQLIETIQAILSSATPNDVLLDEASFLLPQLQKEVGLNLSNLDQNQLMEQVSKLIENLNVGKTTKEIKDEIQNFLDVLQNQSQKENGEKSVLFDTRKQDIHKETKPWISLDKSQLIGQMSTSALQVNDVWNVSKAVPTAPTVHISNFVPEVSEWMGRSIKIMHGTSGSTEARFSLFPEHLGHIEIKITTTQGQVSAEIVTNTLLAKEALEGQISNLKQTLQQNGLHVQKLDIVQNLTQVSLDSNQTSMSFSHGGSGYSNEQRFHAESDTLTKKNKEVEVTEIDGEKESLSYGRTSGRTVSSIDFTA